jgi:hypothetical protein
MEFSVCVNSNLPHRKSSSLKAIFAYTDIALNWISVSLKMKSSSLNRLIILTRSRLLFYAFSSQPGTTLGKSFQKIG